MTFEIFFQNKHNSVYALVMSHQREERQRKQKSNYHEPVMKEQLTTTRKPNKK